MANKNFHVQLRCPIVVSKTIIAESMEDALAKAKAIAKEQLSAKPQRGWTLEYSEDYEVVAVLSD